jgi:hypothetical protein
LIDKHEAKWNELYAQVEKEKITWEEYDELV